MNARCLVLSVLASSGWSCEADVSGRYATRVESTVTMNGRDLTSVHDDVQQVTRVPGGVRLDSAACPLVMAWRAGQYKLVPVTCLVDGVPMAYQSGHLTVQDGQLALETHASFTTFGVPVTMTQRARGFRVKE